MEPDEEVLLHLGGKSGTESSVAPSESSKSIESARKYRLIEELGVKNTQKKRKDKGVEQLAFASQEPSEQSQKDDSFEMKPRVLFDPDSEQDSSKTMLNLKIDHSSHARSAKKVKAVIPED